MFYFYASLLLQIWLCSDAYSLTFFEKHRNSCAAGVYRTDACRQLPVVTSQLGAAEIRPRRRPTSGGRGTADHGSSVQPGVKQLRSRQGVVRMARRGWRPQAANVALVVYLLCDVTSSTRWQHCLNNGCCYNSGRTQLTCNFRQPIVSITTLSATGEHCRKSGPHIC